MLTVTICSDASNGLEKARIVIPGSGSKHHEGAKKGEHCAFSGLAKVAIGGAGAALLSLSLAFILLLGLAPLPRPPLGRTSYLRPPLRGPPAVG